MISKYQNQNVDLDYIYISASDSNYNSSSLVTALNNRKTVMFGQQLIGNYPNYFPIGNLNNAVNYAQVLTGIQVDQDSTTIVGVTPTSVFYKNRANTSQTLIRGNFSLLENFPQNSTWQTLGQQANGTSVTKITYGL